MSEYAINLEHLTKKFGKFTAVDNFSLQLETGKVYGIVGPNGAGKSTTMAMIMGSIIPTEGTGQVMGFPLGSKEALQNLGYSPEFTSFYSDMSCGEYLWYMGTLAGLSSQEAMNRSIELMKEFDLTEHVNKKVAKFSTGMKKKVSIAQAMIHHPNILLLDEPTANLDPTSRMEVLDIVRRMVHQQHLTVLISSHVLTELETVIDHVVMINHGKLVLNSGIEEAKQRFKNGILIVQTDHNEKLFELLKDHYPCQLDQDCVKITCEDSSIVKKDVVKAVYENNLQLDSLAEEFLSLDYLYKQALEANKNEANI